jgi:hypothetical protein
MFTNTANIPPFSHDSKNPSENLQENWKIPVEVLRHLFLNKSTHLATTYLNITRDPDFSGHITKAKLPLLAKKQNSTSVTINKHLEQLERLNLVEMHGDLCMAVGADWFTARTGTTKVKLVDVPKTATRRFFTTLSYAIFISEEQKRKTWKRRVKALPTINEHGQAGTPQETTQGINDGLKRTQISCSYTKLHISNYSRTKRSIQTISTQRCRAKRLGLLNYERSFHMKEQQVFNPETRATEYVKMVGGTEIAARFNHAKAQGTLSGNEVLSKRKDGSCAWFVEHPALFLSSVSFTKRGMSGKQKAHAVEYYLLLNNK